MASAPTKNPTESDARVPVTPDELSQALEVGVYDRSGKATKLGDLVHGKRTALIFTRHFWCVNCQAYIRYMSASMPPSNLPPNTQILIIGCGTHHPIDNYAAASSSKYPVYTDPTQRLHAIFKFKWTLSQGQSGDEVKDYMGDAGGVVYRIYAGWKYAMSSISHINDVGPKSLNGGEVVIGADGKCEFVHRMQNTVDHAHVKELAGVLGARFDEGMKEEGGACGEACGVEPGKA
ncbi:hypothetical protein CC86DRAFT_331112 [Ophiobolus disseminans]|uniref:Thioredoxin-like protein n=1 Tax=Ophiobolus disseminans TaxID=1469910 RepID=A0A6A6ZM94_9PLEO|nr:hypothetical protein CC86DRAFT_331112 [Ophiobolus disseminans]